MSSPSVAHADDEGGLDVTLEVAPCVRADAARVRRLFELELGTSHADAAGAAKGARLSIHCDGELILLSVHDPVTRKTLSRTIDPGPPAGRDRLIALAVLELLVASWAELAATPEPVGEPAGSRADASARSNAREVVRTRLPAPARGWDTILVASFGAVQSTQLHPGGGVRLARLGPDGWGFTVDLTGRRAVDQLELGDVTVSSLATSTAIVGHRRLESVIIAGGGGFRAALVSLDGDAGGAPGVTAGEVTGVAGGPMLWGGADLVMDNGFTVGISTEAGWHLFEVSGTVDGERQTGADRGWIAANLEVGWTF